MECRDLKAEFSTINCDMRNRNFRYYSYNQLHAERRRVLKEQERHDELAHSDLEPLYEQLADLRIELREMCPEKSSMRVQHYPTDYPTASMPPGIKILCARRARYLSSPWILF